MILDFITSLQKLNICAKLIFSIILFVENNNLLVRGILTSRVFINGHSNGPYIPEAPVNYLFGPSSLSSSSLKAPNLSDDFFQKYNSKADPSQNNIGESIAKKILKSFHLIDEESERTVPNQNYESRPKKIHIKKSHQRLPSGATVVYIDDGDSLVLQDDTMDDVKGDTKSGQSEDDEVDDGDHGGAIKVKRPKNGQNGNRKEVENDDDDNEKEAIVSVKSKPGRYVTKKVFKGKDGELTAVDWVEDKEQDEHGLYHTEEWEDLLQKHGLIRNADWKEKLEDKDDEKKKEENDEIEDQSKSKVDKKRKKKRKKKKKKMDKQKNQDTDNDSKDDEKETVIDGDQIPQILWSYLSRKNGKDSSPIEQIKISKV